MKSRKLMYIIGISIVLLVSVIIGLVFVDTQVSSPKPSSQTNSTNSSSSQIPTVNQPLQECIARANNSEASQILIEEAKKECERLYAR